MATPFAPSNAPGAIALIQLRADDATSLDRALLAMGMGGLAPGQMRVRRVLGVDECVVARWSDVCAHVMPHAGRAVMRAMIAALQDIGVVADQGGDDPRGQFPEARDLIDACLCQAMWRAQSPRALDALAEHAARWRDRLGDTLAGDSPEARQLARLIDPPIVVGWGPANIGKSSLLNALARRAVSIVADRPGTTRDHVGVTLELDGLTVRWIDAPGLGAGDDHEDRSAMQMALVLAASADLVLLMGDAVSGFPQPPEGYRGPDLKCGTRSDLGIAHGADVSTSAREGRGLGDLARCVRRALVSDETLATAGRWRFSAWLA